jgi:hypothetical protein
MASRYDTYGFTATTLEEVAPLVQQLLGLPLQERDSSYYAGTYYLYRKAYGRELKLYRNHDPVRGSWVREHNRDQGVILEVSDLDDMDDIQRKLMSGLKGVVLLSSWTLPDELADEE